MIKDIDIAKKKLIDNDLTLVIVKNNNIIYNSKDRGILPIYLAVTNESYDTKDAATADKVTGKGAALLCVYGKIKSLHTGIISKPALQFLEDNDIIVTYDKLVDFIKNRAGDGRCPVEILSDDIINPKDIIEPVRQFLTKIGML